jgi:hypothetical protein
LILVYPGDRNLNDLQLILIVTWYQGVEVRTSGEYHTPIADIIFGENSNRPLYWN